MTVAGRDLRGPVGGAARAHRGLQALWAELEADDVPSDETLCRALDDWLAAGPPCALAIGPQVLPRRRALAAWARSVADRRAAEVVFLPLSRVHGTATLREALALLFGLFPTAETAAFSNARSPAELQAAIGLALQGVGWVAVDPTPDDPVLVLVVEGLDELFDAAPEDLLDLPDLGVGARLLVAARDERADGEPLGEALGFTADDTQIVHTTAAFDRTTANRARDDAPAERDEATTLLDLLAVVAAPLDLVDLEEIATAPPWAAVDRDHILAAAQAAADDENELGFAADPRWCREPDGRLRFVDDDARRAWVMARNRTLDASGLPVLASLEERLIEVGLSRARREPGDDRAGYLVEHLGAHLRRRRATSRDWNDLVTPHWLSWWRRRPAWLLGFVSDVSGARDAAVARLAVAAGEAERAEALGDLVRCVLVEGALFSKEGSRRARRDRTLPYRRPEVDLARPTGAEEARAIALVTAASRLRGAPAVEVGELARHALSALTPERAQAIAPAPVPEVALAPADGSPEHLLEQAERVDHAERVEALAAALPRLPEPLRGTAAARAIDAYREHGDRDTERALVALAPWMSIEDATDLFVHVCENPNSDLDERLTGWAGLTDQLPLLLRLGGPPAIVAAARQIADVATWLP